MLGSHHGSVVGCLSTASGLEITLQKQKQSKKALCCF
jgi:hypothetical protein